MSSDFRVNGEREREEEGGKRETEGERSGREKERGAEGEPAH